MLHCRSPEGRIDAAELDDVTVLVSAYEPDEGHGWTTELIDRMLSGTEEDEP